MQQDKKLKALEAFAAGCTWAEAADRAGVNRVTLWRWSQHDPGFAEAIAAAKAGPDDEVEAITYQNCLDPDPAHNTLRMFWLKCRKPNVYQDRQQHDHGGKVNILHTYVEPGLPPSPLGTNEGGE